MLQILLHSSKTMRTTPPTLRPVEQPQFLSQSKTLVQTWREASRDDISKRMKVSDALVSDVIQMYAEWTDRADATTPAIDAFLGDIYSGLQVGTWDDSDRLYAHNHLLILSGLYGALRACDGISPYRLEMGYKLPDGQSMYRFWGEMLAGAIHPTTKTLINLSAVEYTKSILPHVSQYVITPKFFTISPKTNEPTFVTVHTKIARGAFARWLIQSRIDDISNISDFSELGYIYDRTNSTPEEPIFICERFQGLALSVRT